METHDTTLWTNRCHDEKYGEERTEISGKLSKDGIINFITKNSVDKILEGTERTAGGRRRLLR